MIEAGILDPTKVTRLALQNAASVAGLLLTTEVMIAEAPKDEASMAMAAPRAAWAAWTCNATALPLVHLRRSERPEKAGRRLPAFSFGGAHLRPAGAGGPGEGRRRLRPFQGASMAWKAEPALNLGWNR